MRRTASSHASPARHRIQIPGALRAEPSGSMARRSAQWTGEAAVTSATAGQHCKDKVREKIRPDFSRRPTGPSLISEEECQGPHLLSLILPTVLSFLLPHHSLCLLLLFQSKRDIYLFIFLEEFSRNIEFYQKRFELIFAFNGSFAMDGRPRQCPPVSPKKSHT